jgi:hypothetical protein
MKLGRAIAVVVLPLLLCGAKPPATPEPGSSAEQAAAAIARMLKVDAKVTLVEAGAEPRRVVRFAPKPGTVTVLETTQQIASRVRANGQDMAVPATGAVLESRTTVGRPDAAGTTRVRVEWLGGKPLADTPLAMADAYDRLRGLTIDILVDRDGTMSGVEATGAADPVTAAMVENMADQMSKGMPQFPAEAVGVGGRWRTELTMDFGGFACLVQTDSVVTSLSESAVDLDQTLVLQRSGTDGTFPGLPPGAKIDFRRFEGRGAGTQHVDLEGVVSMSTQAIGMDLEMSVSGGGSAQAPQVVSMRMDQKLEMRVVGR